MEFNLGLDFAEKYQDSSLYRCGLDEHPKPGMSTSRLCARISDEGPAAQKAGHWQEEFSWHSAPLVQGDGRL